MDNFKTRDLYLSAFLITLGQNLYGVDFDSSGKFFWFVFNNPTECEKLENELSFGEAMANARNLITSIRYLKKKVSEINNPNTNSTQYVQQTV